MRVKGKIYNRTYEARGIAMEEIEIAPTNINSDGTFAGEVTQAQQPKGDYGGAFGGPNANAVAGALFASDHETSLPDVEEYGLFVLERSN